jgi:hypothetical protein
MLAKKSLITILSLIAVIAAYIGFSYAISEKCLSPQSENLNGNQTCLSMNEIGCIKVDDKIYLHCVISVDNRYLTKGELPIFTVEDDSTGEIVAVVEMEYYDSRGGTCSRFVCGPEVPHAGAYGISVYMSKLAKSPALTLNNSMTVVVCE